MELITEIFNHLKTSLGTQGITIVLLALALIYIWYLHLSKKLLIEKIEHDKEKKKKFIESISVAHPEESAKKIPNLSGKAKSVLIVDDENLMTETLSSMVRSAKKDVSVDTACDGEDALIKIGENKPSVMILDIAMPKKSGIDVLKELRSKEINIPILVLSGYASSDVLEAAGFKIGKNLLFMSKPADIEEIINSLNKLVE